MIFPLLALLLAFAAWHAKVNSFTLVVFYAAFFILFELDIFSGFDFMFILFLASSVCIFLSYLSSKITGLWSSAFIVLQLIAIANYFSLCVLYLSDSYSYLKSTLTDINDLLCFADTIALFGIVSGDNRAK